MIPDSVLNPRDHWTPIATREQADAIAHRCNTGDDGPGLYEVEAKGAAFAVAYSEDGEFIAYI